MWDCNGAVKTSVTDQNSKITSYIYGDPDYWRLTETDLPDGGKVTTNYNLGTNRPWNIVNSTKLTSTQSITKKTVYDTLARVSQQQLTTDTEGIDYTDTTYDAAGHVHSVSNLYRTTADSTYGLTFYTYDGMGRAIAQTQPDGSSVESAYNANCTTVTDEAGNFRKSCADGLGRLIEVDEPGAGALPAKAGRGGIAISGGSDQSGTFNMCPTNPNGPCNQTIPDTGEIYVTVGGFQVNSSYGLMSSASTIASDLATKLSANGSPVTASVSGSSITFTSRGLGAAGNYAWSAVVNWDSHFTAPSFSPCSGGASSCSGAMSGGTDATFGAGPLVTLYQYDILGNLLCAVQKGTDTTAFTTCAAASTTWRPRSFSYDALSRLLSATNPESGTITYTYDNNGNVLTKVAPIPNKIPADTSSPQTITTTFTYEALNRLTKKTYSDGTATAQYAYDGAALIGCTFAVPTLSDTNPKGRRTSMCDGSGATHWALDITTGVGWKTTEARNIAGVTKSTVSQNNFGGMLYQLTYPSGRIITYAATTAARQLSAVDTANSINYAQNATYAPFGGLTGMTNGSAPITTTNAYNERLQPVTLSSATAANTLFSRSFDFHRANGDNGNLFQVVNNLDNARSQSFTYDALNRIASAQSQATSGSKCWGDNFTIDSWGNLTNKAVTKCTAETLNAPATIKNQISGYCYDKAGNLLGTSGCPSLPYTPTYSYDGENRLRTAGGVTYTCDGDGNRVKKSSGTLYWGSGPLAESDLSATSTSWKEYIFFDAKRIARRDASNNSVHYYFSDQLGSSSVITNSTGTLPAEEDLDYFPYGGIAFGAPSDHYEFNGKERDSESGLDNFGARYDSSNLGRFMTPDWAATAVAVPYAKFGDPQSLNLYSYVENGPINRIDADGHTYSGEFHCGVGRHCTGDGPLLGGSCDDTTGNCDSGEETVNPTIIANRLVAEGLAQWGDPAQNQNSDKRTDIMLVPNEFENGQPKVSQHIGNGYEMDYKIVPQADTIQEVHLDPRTQEKYSKIEIKLWESQRGEAWGWQGSLPGHGHDVLFYDAKRVDQRWYANDGSGNKRIQLVIGKDSNGNLIKTWTNHVEILKPNPKYSKVD